MSHFLSGGERDVALLIRWAGASDVREQFPLYGWEHPNPSDELHGAGTHAPHPGLERVAADAGIRLTPYPGTGIPIVLTIDMMVTVYRRHCGQEELVGVSCKPRRGGVKRHGLGVLERLELDRRYCKAAGIRYLLLHPEAFPRNLIATLLWVSPQVTRERYRQIRGSEAYQQFLAMARSDIYLLPAFRVIDDAARHLRIAPNVAAEMLKIAIWSQDFDVDVDRRLSFSQSLSHGGRETRRRLADLLFGGVKGV